jgi:hypothetical protein
MYQAEINYELDKLAAVNYNVTKLLDLTIMIRNKIRIENYILRKIYIFKICFFGLSYLHYT